MRLAQCAKPLTLTKNATVNWVYVRNAQISRQQGAYTVAIALAKNARGEKSASHRVYVYIVISHISQDNSNVGYARKETEHISANIESARANKERENHELGLLFTICVSQHSIFMLDYSQ